MGARRRGGGPPEGEVDRTTFEIQEVLGAPLAVELAAAAQAMADEIKKLPPEAQPPALALALEVIDGLEAAADAFVGRLPAIPPTVPQEHALQLIQNQIAMMKKYLLKQVAQ